MNKLMIVGRVSILLCFWMCSAIADNYQLEIVNNDHGFLINKGDYHYTFLKVSDFDTDWRLYSNNSIEKIFRGQNIGEAGVLSHLLMAGSVEESNKDFVAEHCEKQATTHAKFFQTIAMNGGVKNAIDNFNTRNRLCVHVQGSQMSLKSYIHNNDEPSSRWGLGNGVPNLNNQEFYLISNIEQVSCNNQ